MIAVPDGGTGLDNEAVDALAREFAELRAAMEQVDAFARADDLAGHHFGELAARLGTGGAFCAARDGMRESFGRAVPVLDGMVRALAESARRLHEVDEEAAQRFRRLSEGLS